MVEKCLLLKDIAGNLFRPVALDPAWQNPAVLTLARMIYEERAFDRMSALADVLRDAGYQNQEVLGHCLEQEGVHVRGCWCIDLLLGKS